MENKKEKTTKISIFLHKEKVRGIENCLKESQEIIYDEIFDLDENIDLEGKIYIGKNTTGNQPAWSRDLNKLSNKEIVFEPNLSNRAVAIIKYENRFFSIAFGYGRMMLNLNSIVKNFGLKVAANVLDEDKLSKVSTRNIGNSSMVNNTTQPVLPLNINQTSIDTYTNIFKSLSGVPLNDSIGTMVTGSESLQVRGKINFSNLKSIIREYYNLYKRDDYIDNGFEWIDNIRIEHDKEITDELDKKLLSSIADDPQNIVIQTNFEGEMDTIEGFYISGTGSKVDDIISNPLKYQYYIDNINKYLKKGNKKLIQKLQSNQIHARDFDGNQEKITSVYNGIVFETVYQKSKYILISGDWYKVNSEYYERVSNNIKQIPVAGIAFPKFKFLKEPQPKGDAKREREDVYNERISDDNYILMDKKIYRSVQGKNQSIEPCDLFSLNPKRFIHVKVGNSSSALSHLFNQAYISAQLFPTDLSFKKHIRELLPTNKQSIIDFEDSNSEYEIVIAIVDQSNRSIYDVIPFFSKISLDNISQRIKSMGYKLSLLKIDVEVVDEL